MDNNERIIQKVEKDYDEFKQAILEKSDYEIFDLACKIFYIGEIRIILTSQGEYTDEETDVILNFGGNILEQIYDEWIGSSHTGTDGLEEIIDDAISGLCNRKK